MVTISLCDLVPTVPVSPPFASSPYSSWPEDPSGIDKGIIASLPTLPDNLRTGDSYLLIRLLLKHDAFAILQGIISADHGRLLTLIPLVLTPIASPSYLSLPPLPSFEITRGADLLHTTRSHIRLSWSLLAHQSSVLRELEYGIPALAPTEPGEPTFSQTLDLMRNAQHAALDALSNIPFPPSPDSPEYNWWQQLHEHEWNLARAEVNQWESMLVHHLSQQATVLDENVKYAEAWEKMQWVTRICSGAWQAYQIVTRVAGDMSERETWDRWWADFEEEMGQKAARDVLKRDFEGSVILRLFGNPGQMYHF